MSFKNDIIFNINIDNTYLFEVKYTCIYIYASSNLFELEMSFRLS